MNLRVGQMVACIWDDWHKCEVRPLPSQLPVRKCVYTIRDITWRISAENHYLRFQEILNPGGPEHEAGFLHVHFRPVVTTDISVFKSVLAPRTREEVA